MTVDKAWVLDRFNLQYNNIFSNKAPGLLEDEISMYLTMAHIEIIDEYSASVDVFEKNRAILSGYIYDDVINGSISTTQTRGIDYQTFEFSTDYWRILKESAKIKSKSIEIPVKPISYDVFNSMSQNPFKKPNGYKAWRLDINNDPFDSTSPDGKRDVKILFKKKDITDYIEYYNVVYLTTPVPFNNTINLKTGAAQTAVFLPETLTYNIFLTEKIINRACELSTRDYKENTLQTQVQINKRSE
jgi:hypothetical protein